MWYSFINRLKASFGLADVVDILVVAFLVYEAIILVRKTRTAQLAKGIIALLLVWAVASFAHLRTLQFILDNLMSWGLIALVIVFQPELRRALEQVGNTNILSAGFLRPRARGASLREEWRKAALAVCDAAERFSDTRTGALMVFEKRSNLSEIIKTGTVLDSEVTQEMLGTIFYVGTPLPDGIRNLDALQSVDVTFDTYGFATRTVTVSQISVVNAPGDTAVTVTTRRLNDVTLVGPEEELNALSEANVVAQVDASAGNINVSKGQQSMPATIVVPGSDTVFATGSYEVLCDIDAAEGAG